MKKVLKEIIPYIVIILIVILIRTFIVTPVQVDGASMYPTLSNNEILLLKKYDKSYERFDIVVLKYNKDKLIKRIIGLPGEYIEFKNDRLYVDGKEIKQNFKRNTETDDFSLSSLFSEGVTVPKDSYFVMGDNRGNSTDSRVIGFIKKKNIEGTIGIAIFPFNKFGKVK